MSGTVTRPCEATMGCLSVLALCSTIVRRCNAVAAPMQNSRERRRSSATTRLPSSAMHPRELFPNALERLARLHVTRVFEWAYASALLTLAVFALYALARLGNRRARP